MCFKIQATLDISSRSGSWITPAFQLHLSRLDAILPRPLEALAQVRRPLIGQAAAAAGAAPAAAASATAPANGTTAVDAAASSRTEAANGAAAAANGETMACSTAVVTAAGQEQLAACASGAAVTNVAAASTTTSTTITTTITAAAASAPPAPWLTHVVFDCDGVLVDSERASCEALRRAILVTTGLDIPHQFPHDFVEVFGMDVRSCVAHYGAKHGLEWDVDKVAAQVGGAIKSWLALQQS